MGLQFRPSWSPVATEAISFENEPNKVNAFEANFTNYGNWVREIAATSGSLQVLPIDNLVKGMIPYSKASLMIKAILALNKLMDPVLSKKEPIDFTKVSGINEMKKVGMTATENMIDNTKFKDGSWMGSIPKGPVALKKNGWSASNAMTFSKQLQTAIEGVGTYQEFKSAVKSMTDKLTKNAKTPSDERKKLSAATKQAVRLFWVRHAVIVKAYKQFTSLKKTI